MTRLDGLPGLTGRVTLSAGVTMGTEDQWVQGTRETVGSEDQWVQRTREKVGTEDMKALDGTVPEDTQNC